MGLYFGWETPHCWKPGVPYSDPALPSLSHKIFPPGAQDQRLPRACAQTGLCGSLGQAGDCSCGKTGFFPLAPPESRRATIVHPQLSILTLCRCSMQCSKVPSERPWWTSEAQAENLDQEPGCCPCVPPTKDCTQCAFLGSDVLSLAPGSSWWRPSLSSPADTCSRLHLRLGPVEARRVGCQALGICWLLTGWRLGAGAGAAVGHPTCQVAAPASGCCDRSGQPSGKGWKLTGG